MLPLLLLGHVGAAPSVVRVGSARTVDPLAAAWVRLFNASAAGESAEVAVSGRYPTDAIGALIDGRVDIAVVARELYTSEREAARRAGGGELLLFPVATGTRAERGGTHALALYVHEKNPLARLTLDQLAGIIARDGPIRTWADVGVTGPLAAQPIRVHGLTVRRESGNPPGVVNYLEHAVLPGREWRQNLVVHADQPKGLTALESIVRGVAADEAALGYSGFDYAVPGVKALALARSASGPFFTGTEAEVAARDYPLSRTVYLCLRSDAPPGARRFAGLALGAAGQEAIARTGTGFFRLPAVMLPAGAGYVTADGAVRVVGYNDMREMLEALTARFAARHPGLRFDFSLPGTKAAPEALARGVSAFAPMGAEFSPEQLALYRQQAGGDPLVIRIAHASLSPAALSGPLAVFVHRNNPLREISLPRLAAIFSGRDPGGHWQPCGLSADTALGRFFSERVLAGGGFAAGYAGFAQSSDVVRHVAAHPNAIGFAAAMRGGADVCALALAAEEGAPAVELTEANLRAGRYPLDRHLLIAVRRPVEPWVRTWLEFVLSDEGQEIIGQGKLGYLPLGPEEAARERARIE